ncbi:hypothetical protein OG338_27350 [Streptomyces sp. NBC_00726]|uniref:hypothetical protein n=1 Tax=Streptomyces sp. NBC_00726 TaxID=2903674 RepID=UPI0038642C42
MFLFDLGGAVCRFHRERRLELPGAACGLSARRVESELYGAGLIAAWGRGQGSADECALGATKPAGDAFAGVLGMLGAVPGEAFFVDGREANVRAARELGLTAVLFEGGAALRRTPERPLTG